MTIFNPDYFSPYFFDTGEVTASSNATSTIIANSSSFYNVLLNSDTILSITIANISSNFLDEELFNNDPDVAVDEYVLIFKRKP